MQKYAPKYVCEICDYKCTRKFCLTQHESTTKHINATLKLNNATPKYDCKNCQKSFNHHSSLYRHQSKCKIKETNNQDIVNELKKQNDDFKHLIIEQNKLFVEQNQGLQQQIIDICKNSVINNNVIQNNQVIQNNKTFNLQVFLNEECKDAMNITDFMSREP